MKVVSPVGTSKSIPGGSEAPDPDVRRDRRERRDRVEGDLPERSVCHPVQQGARGVVSDMLRYAFTRKRAGSRVENERAGRVMRISSHSIVRYPACAPDLFRRKDLGLDQAVRVERCTPQKKLLSSHLFA